LAIATLVLAASATATTAQDRVARTPSATDRAGPAAVSQGQAAIARAAAAQKYVFIFFWREKNPQTDKAWGVFQPAAAKLADAAEVVSIQMTNPAEKKVVDAYDVSRAPMPLVLSVAPCGAITKAFTGTFDESHLRTALVSPCTAECMKALQDRKLVLLCVAHPSPQVQQVSLQKGVQDFTTDREYAQASKVVVLDAGDPAEAPFLKSLQVDPRTNAPVTVLMAPPGSVVGTFVGDVTKAQLVAKLKAAQSSCCPGGKCGPGGCGPAK
jgi:hypothetical protein